MVRAWCVFTKSTGSKSYKVIVAFSCKHVCKFTKEAQFLCFHWCVTIMLNSYYTHTFIYNDGTLLHVKCVTWCYFQKEIAQNAVIKSASFRVDVDHFALVFRREFRPYFHPFFVLRTSYNIQEECFQFDYLMLDGNLLEFTHLVHSHVEQTTPDEHFWLAKPPFEAILQRIGTHRAKSLAGKGLI